MPNRAYGGDAEGRPMDQSVTETVLGSCLPTGPRDPGTQNSTNETWARVSGQPLLPLGFSPPHLPQSDDRLSTLRAAGREIKMCQDFELVLNAGCFKIKDILSKQKSARSQIT